MIAGADQRAKQLYEFGPFRVDPEKELLLRGDTTVPLTPKTFQILLVLIRHKKEIVTKDELMKQVWPDTFVEEANLSRNIFLLRKALGENPQDHQYIVTVPGRGYRFAEEVQFVPGQNVNIVAASHSRVQVQVKETRPWGWIAAAACLLIATAIGAYKLFAHRRPALTEKDTIVLADFTNSTTDPVFDDTLSQGLAVELEQSPFLSLISDERVRQTLQMMEQKRDTKLTPEIAREVCLRNASAADLEGSIGQIGSQYLLTLKAVNCANGETLASAEAKANDKNHVLDALDTTASEMRKKLGESLNTVQKYDIPLEKATTPSLEALKAYSSGIKVMSTGNAAAIPFFQQAIALDPNFALAYVWLGIEYTSLGEANIAVGYTAKAYQLRDRASEPERDFISVVYDKEVTGNIPMALQSSKLWIEAYPRMFMPHTYLAGAIYPIIGDFQKAADESSEAILLNPESPYAYGFLMLSSKSLNHLDQAKAAYALASQRKLRNPFYPLVLYQVAFLEHDVAAMSQQVTASTDQPIIEDEMLSMEADTAAYAGRLTDAQEFSSQAMESAERRQEKEVATTYLALSALREALFGNSREAEQRASEAMDRPADVDAQYGSALAFAYAGDEERARTITAALDKQFPENTIVQSNYLPTLRAKFALSNGKPFEAIEILRAAAPYELGESTYSAYNCTSLYPAYVRGEAYLAARQGTEAAAEFQKILAHPGVVIFEPIGALAHLGLARAYALEAKTSQGPAADAAHANARKAYQDFLTLWQNADPNLPVFKQAQAEYAKLK